MISIYSKGTEQRGFWDSLQVSVPLGPEVAEGNALSSRAFPGARARSGPLRDLSCSSHPITHCATFTYRGQGWMKGLLNKWGEREGEDGRGGGGHAELHIYLRGLILSSRLCLHLAHRGCNGGLGEERRKAARGHGGACRRTPTTAAHATDVVVVDLTPLQSSGSRKSSKLLEPSWQQFLHTCMCACVRVCGGGGESHMTEAA